MGYISILSVVKEKGIIYGVNGPSALFNLAPIPQSGALTRADLKYISYPLSGYVNVRSLAVDPKQGVVFLASQANIYAVHNYSLQQTDSYALSTVFQGKSDDTGEIAFDYLSNNLFWCDSRLNWVAMKPAYSGNASLYRVLVQNNLYRPEGLALDPVDGYEKIL